MMRIPALVILTIATVLTAAPARAQTYDPAYPVCLHVYGRGATYYECRYTSLPQCNASASGRAGQCVINPYFASAQVPALFRFGLYGLDLLVPTCRMLFATHGTTPF
jgi:hypothetical protein